MREKKKESEYRKRVKEEKERGRGLKEGQIRMNGKSK